MGAGGLAGSEEAKWSHFIHTVEAEREEKGRLGYKTSDPNPSDILPLAKLHILKLPEPSQTVPLSAK